MKTLNMHLPVWNVLALMAVREYARQPDIGSAALLIVCAVINVGFAVAAVLAYRQPAAERS
jgi:hypothetical protein